MAAGVDVERLLDAGEDVGQFGEGDPVLAQGRAAARALPTVETLDVDLDREPSLSFLDGQSCVSVAVWIA